MNPDPENLTGKYILDADWTPVEEPDVLTWGRWMETADRQLAHDTDETGTTDLRVSTVFLGVDHNPARGIVPGAVPILWETMVFDGDRPLHQHSRRYPTKDEALEGHQAVCRALMGRAENQT